jgi:hypothetical protein
MFLTANCVEAQTGVIEIKGIKAGVMEGLIKYMYLGKLGDFGSIVVDLFKAADKYKIQDLKVRFVNIIYTTFILKKLCAESIAKSLNENTLFDIVVLGYMYKCDTLKTSVFDLFVENPKDGHFAKLILSNQWINFSGEHKELAAEIINDVIGKIKITC